MYFALPTRAAARQIHGRIQAALQRLLGDEAARYVTLAVPGYITRQAEGASLPEPDAHWPDASMEARHDALWASERPKRYLAGWVAVGTIDQVLMAGLRVRHAQLRSGAMLRLLLVVDEVHASDTYMTAILRNVLDQHRRAGGHALLMSATLGSAARARLLQPTGRALEESQRSGLASSCCLHAPVDRVAAVAALFMGVTWRTRSRGSMAMPVFFRPAPTGLSLHNLLRHSPEARPTIGLGMHYAGQTGSAGLGCDVAHSDEAAQLRHCPSDRSIAAPF
jgi:hypothetical protein